jgi:zinc finger SWIM domain-containing protein 3
MYNIEYKPALEEAFSAMKNKVEKKKIPWLECFYKFKEKQAECYMRDICHIRNEEHTIK